MDKTESNKIKFYSFHKCTIFPEIAECRTFIDSDSKIKYPCLVLIRDNTWNDYSFYTHFCAFFLPDNKEIICLGIIKIIQSKKETEDLYTNLPDIFEFLPKKEFFSRGNIHFYEELNKLGKFKDEILLSLNDVHYGNCTKEDIIKIDGNLLWPYQQSLFREDILASVSSEYSKNALAMLDTINSCLTSISKLNGDEQKIIRRLLFGSGVASLESYLGDAFKYHIIFNKSYFYSFLKNYEFPKGDKKYDLKELGLHGNQIGEHIETQVKKIMNDISFHNIPLVYGLYQDILNIKLPSMIFQFKEAVDKRHDIFHRNGKTIAGNELDITTGEISELISNVKKFVREAEHIIEATASKG